MFVDGTHRRAAAWQMGPAESRPSHPTPPFCSLVMHVPGAKAWLRWPCYVCLGPRRPAGGRPPPCDARWVTAPFLHLTLGFAGTADLGGNVSAFQKHRQGSGTANAPEPASPSPPSTHGHPETTLNTGCLGGPRPDGGKQPAPSHAAEKPVWGAGPARPCGEGRLHLAPVTAWRRWGCAPSSANPHVTLGLELITTKKEYSSDASQKASAAENRALS